MSNTIGLKEFRTNLEKYMQAITKGESFVVVKHAKPIFKVTPLDVNNSWEEVIDFTQLTSDGINIDNLLTRLKNIK